MPSRRTLKGSRVFSLESSIVVRKDFTIEVCPKNTGSQYIDKAIVTFSAANGNAIEVIPKSIEFEDDDCLKSFREESDCLVRHITQRFTLHYSTLHQTLLTRDNSHEELTADDNRIVVEARQKQCADIKIRISYPSRQENISRLQGFLNEDSKEQDIYSDMFCSALGMTDPIAIYMSLYAIGLYLCDREEQYQSRFDDFICEEFQEERSCKSEKNQSTKKKHEKSLKGSEKAEGTEKAEKANEKMVTKYTYLRNRLAHFKAKNSSTSKDSSNFYDLNLIRREMHDALPKLKCIAKKAIIKKSVVHEE